MTDRHWLPWLILLAGAVAALVCLAVGLPQFHRLGLVHAAFYDSCAIHTYQVHWQNRRLHPEALRYDFTLSQASFVLIEIWVEDGPTLSLSQVLPVRCP